MAFCAIYYIIYVYKVHRFEKTNNLIRFFFIYIDYLIYLYVV